MILTPRLTSVSIVSHADCATVTSEICSCLIRSVFRIVEALSTMSDTIAASRIPWEWMMLRFLWRERGHAASCIIESESPDMQCSGVRSSCAISAKNCSCWWFIRSKSPCALRWSEMSCPDTRMATRSPTPGVGSKVASNFIFSQISCVVSSSACGILAIRSNTTAPSPRSRSFSFWSVRCSSSSSSHTKASTTSSSDTSPPARPVTLRQCARANVFC
mmetsp:Transcript_56226/g.131713  ORF Transcript_56226/g.131713 Transcript_56226/m.131713 type:complete len:218 (-) Transcript_56226:673-1326(-)